MSSSQVYASLTGTITPEQMCGDVENGIVSTDWYAPSSYAFDQSSYMTPYPSSTMEAQQWNQYARASVPDMNMHSYLNQQAPQFAPPQQLLSTAPGRPRSSPSTFGPSPESIAWTPSTGLGIQYSTVTAAPTPATSTFPATVFNYPGEDLYTTSSPPELRQPVPRRPYQSIAPNPAGVAAALKRRRDEEDTDLSSSSSTKKRKRTSSVASADMSEDDRFLVQLKETESLPWKDIATRFSTDRGKQFQVAALQMRYKRLREKFRVWETKDVQALKQAHEYWERFKWEIIGQKMLDYGLTERWPARHCARKWQEMEFLPPSTTQAMASASISQFSSPVEAPVHFAYAWQPL